MRGQDVVYANLAGDMARQARVIVDAMHAAGLKRLIFISSMGIYREVPGETYRSVLDPYRDFAALIEQSDLDYTILRPGWFTRAAGRPLPDYTEGRAFPGPRHRARQPVRADRGIATTPGLYVRCQHRRQRRLTSITHKKGRKRMTKVIVVIGPGSIGQAIARRVGAGKHLLLADLRQENADAAAKTLSEAGFEVTTTTVDVSSRGSVEALVAKASSLGDVHGVIHAAGVSPSQASPETILKVDLYGTALVLEEFGKVIAEGGAGVVIASQSGHRLPPLSTEQNHALATTPVEELLKLPMLQPDEVKDSLHAYQLSKRGNSLRVMSEAVRWGKRGARINTISPGIIMTPLAKDELTGPRGAGYRRMIDGCPAKRAGTPDEVGNVAALLMGAERCFYHRKRLPDGWRRHLILLVRRAGSEVTGRANALTVSVRAPGKERAKHFLATGRQLAPDWIRGAHFYSGLVEIWRAGGIRTVMSKRFHC